MKKNFGMVLPAAMSLALMAAPALAGATSATNFPAGITEFYNYDQFYDSGNFEADAANPAPPSLRTSVFVEAFRVNHTRINLSDSVTLGAGFALNGVHQGPNIGVANGRVDFGFADPDIISPILPRQRGSPVTKPTCCLFVGR